MNRLALGGWQRKLTAHFQAMFDTSRLLPLTNCKHCVRQAIVVLEWFQLNGYARIEVPKTEADRAQAKLAAAVRGDLGTFELAAQEPSDRVPVQLIREVAVVRSLGTVVYCRARRPATVALEILCSEASVAIKYMVRGFLTDGDCKRLVKAAGRVASAPLTFCDARHAPLQTQSVLELAARDYLRIAVVDGQIGRAHV